MHVGVGVSVCMYVGSIYNVYHRFICNDLYSVIIFIVLLQVLL